MREYVGQQIDDGPREHLIEYPRCGEMIDMRDLADVFAHEQPHGRRRKGPKPKLT